MKRNEKILALGLLVVVVGYFGWPIFDSVFLAPTREARQKRDRLARDVKTASYKQMELALAKNELEDWSRASLPPEPTTGQRLYINWLDDITRLSGLEVVIEAGPRPRGGTTYTAVQANINGSGTFREIKRFLDLFRRVHLLHHVVRLEIGPASRIDGDPALPLELIVEGLCLADAPSRDHLFPQAKLTANLAAETTSLESWGESFPAESGDRLRLDDEIMTILEADESTLTLRRGVVGTSPATHEAGATVELYPSRSHTEVLTQLARLRSPFVKPHDYSPSLEGLDELRVVRGTPFKTTITVADHDPLLGQPTLSVSDAPEGMAFHPVTGELSWTPSAEIAVGTFEFQVTATLPDGTSLLEQTAKIELAEPNSPPTFPPASTKTAFHGETLEWDVAANDAETPDELAYTLSGAPEGVSIEQNTGLITWEVPDTVKPGPVSFTVKATDSGMPALSAQQSLTLTVKENLKPYVYLVGIIRQEHDWEAWLWDRSEGHRITLRENQPFEAVGVAGVVEEIEEERVVFRWNDEIWEMGLGQTMGDLAKVDVAPTTAPLPPVVAPQPPGPGIAERGPIHQPVSVEAR